ncbi:MAG: hypothetical protein J6S30_00860 [Kiritimatiellae bacterium]|nr:hypothetical protein [Kiritimatiellia bacterium]
MGRIIYTILASLALITQANAAWYWPFGSEEAEKPVRMSELMEDASVLVDSAADFAAEGKIPEAIEAYNKAFAELERIERENPERAATSEFSTVRNKKAYVTAAIDSLLLSQATNNARTVAVTDTTELEKKLAEEEAAKEAAKKAVESGEKQVQVKKNVVSESKKLPPTVEKVLSPAKKNVAAETPSGRKSKLMLAAADYAKKDYAAAMLTLKELLKERADDVAALNLKAAVELAEGNVKAAEESLHRSIRSNPRSHYAYYNLARLILETRGPAGKSDARRYYENGREYCAGPVDKTLEEALK